MLTHQESAGKRGIFEKVLFMRGLAIVRLLVDPAHPHTGARSDDPVVG